MKRGDIVARISSERGQIGGNVKRPIAELDELYVKDKFRKKNVGRMLMEKVIETHYNHKAAHKFYEALGFTNYGYHFIKDL
jgi:GNAT superfamily N-acetyltransferase